MPHKPDTLIKYYLKKLAEKHHAETVVCNYCAGSLHVTIFRNTSVIKDYDVKDNKRFQKARKCKFIEHVKNQNVKYVFDSITKAAKFMGLPHSSVQYAIKKGIPIIPKKMSLGVIEFEGWVD